MSEEIKEMTSEVVSYKCNWCGELHKTETDAAECAFDHARVNLANSLLRNGCYLDTIEYHCKFGWKLTEEQKTISKENCFIVSHWQCCKKPAYRIVEIDKHGNLRLWGKGSWDGYYGNFISIDRLPEPHPKEEFFIDQRII